MLWASVELLRYVMEKYVAEKNNLEQTIEFQNSQHDYEPAVLSFSTAFPLTHKIDGNSPNKQ